MDDVEAEEQRDVESALLDLEVLHPVDRLRVREPEDGADAAVNDVAVRRRGHRAAEGDAGGEIELPDLLLERHLAEEGCGASRGISIC